MKKRCRGGFTLIELSLSLIFIAILSLMVVFLIQNVSSSYRRGLILNQVNTVGMDLIDDFRVSVQNATSDPITRMCDVFYPIYTGDDIARNTENHKKCVEDNANSFVSVSKTAQVKIDEDVIGDDILVYGAFCTGTYTYIWNSGYFENADNPDFAGSHIDEREVDASPAVLGIRNELGSFEQRYPLSVENGGEEGDFFRLLKVYDDDRTICVNAMKDQQTYGQDDYIPSGDYQNDKVKNEFVIRESSLEESSQEVVELLKKDKASDLVLYELYVAKPALSVTRKNLFYAASFILGTRRGGINITKAGNSCRPPNDNYTEFEYCAINKFNFAVMAGGK